MQLILSPAIVILRVGSGRDSHFYAWLFAILLQLLWVTVIPVTLLTLTTCTTCLWWLWARTERNSWRAREAGESGHWDCGHSGDCEECGAWRYWPHSGQPWGGGGTGEAGGGSLGQGSQSTGQVLMRGVTFQGLITQEVRVEEFLTMLLNWDLNVVMDNVIMVMFCMMSRHYLICWLRWHNPMSCHETLYTPQLTRVPRIPDLKPRGDHHGELETLDMKPLAETTIITSLHLSCSQKNSEDRCCRD